MFIPENKLITNQNQKSVRTANLNFPKIETEIHNLIEIEKLFCDEDLKLDRFAQLLKIRPDQLSELINSKYNKNYNTYLNDYRIQEAMNLLVSQKNRNILSIAMACGFNSKSSFNREFKKRTGLTPKNYRNTRNKI